MQKWDAVRVYELDFLKHKALIPQAAWFSVLIPASQISCMSCKICWILSFCCLCWILQSNLQTVAILTDGHSMWDTKFDACWRTICQHRVKMNAAVWLCACLWPGLPKTWVQGFWPRVCLEINWDSDCKQVPAVVTHIPGEKTCESVSGMRSLIMLTHCWEPLLAMRGTERLEGWICPVHVHTRLALIPKGISAGIMRRGRRG